MNIRHILTLVLCLVSLIAQSQAPKWQTTLSPKAPVYCFASVGEYLYAGVGGSGILRTNDKGKTWETLNEGLNNSYPSDLLYDEEKTIYLSTFFGEVYQSEDLGETWVPIVEGLDARVVTSLAKKGNLLVAGTSNGIFLRDKKDGFWQRVAFPKSNTLNEFIHCLFIQGNTILAGGTGSLFFSTDGGESWEVSEDVTKYNITDIEKKGSKLLLATSGEGLLETEQNFRQWIKSLEFTGEEDATFITKLYPLGNEIMLKGSSNTGLTRGEEVLNEGLDDLEIRSMIAHQGFLYVGTYRDGVLIFDIDEFPLNDQAKLLGVNTNSTNNIDLSLMPNPAKEMITISFKLEENALPISLQIISEEGRLVKTIFTEEIHDKGVYATSVELNNLPTGIYFAVLTAQDSRITKQFLLKD